MVFGLLSSAAKSAKNAAVAATTAIVSAVAPAAKVAPAPELGSLPSKPQTDATAKGSMEHSARRKATPPLTLDNIMSAAVVKQSMLRISESEALRGTALIPMDEDLQKALPRFTAQRWPLLERKKLAAAVLSKAKEPAKNEYCAKFLATLVPSEEEYHGIEVYVRGGKTKRDAAKEFMTINLNALAAAAALLPALHQSLKAGRDARQASRKAAVRWLAFLAFLRKELKTNNVGKDAVPDACLRLRIAQCEVGMRRAFADQFKGESFVQGAFAAVKTVTAGLRGDFAAVLEGGMEVMGVVVKGVEQYATEQLSSPFEAISTLSACLMHDSLEGVSVEGFADTLRWVNSRVFPPEEEPGGGDVVRRINQGLSDMRKAAHPLPWELKGAFIGMVGETAVVRVAAGDDDGVAQLCFPKHGDWSMRNLLRYGLPPADADETDATIGMHKLPLRKAAAWGSKISSVINPLQDYTLREWLEEGFELFKVEAIGKLSKMADEIGEECVEHLKEITIYSPIAEMRRACRRVVMHAAQMFDDDGSLRRSIEQHCNPLLVPEQAKSVQLIDDMLATMIQAGRKAHTALHSMTSCMLKLCHKALDMERMITDLIVPFALVVNFENPFQNLAASYLRFAREVRESVGAIVAHMNECQTSLSGLCGASEAEAQGDGSSAGSEPQLITLFDGMQLEAWEHLGLHEKVKTALHIALSLDSLLLSLQHTATELCGESNLKDTAAHAGFLLSGGDLPQLQCGAGRLGGAPKTLEELKTALGNGSSRTSILQDVAYPVPLLLEAGVLEDELAQIQAPSWPKDVNRGYMLARPADLSDIFAENHRSWWSCHLELEACAQHLVTIREALEMQDDFHGRYHQQLNSALKAAQANTHESAVAATTALRKSFQPRPSLLAWLIVDSLTTKVSLMCQQLLALKHSPADGSDTVDVLWASSYLAAERCVQEDDGRRRLTIELRDPLLQDAASKLLPVVTTLRQQLDNLILHHVERMIDLLSSNELPTDTGFQKALTSWTTPKLLGSRGTAASRPFVKATVFTGFNEGYVFKLGSEGLGYYRDDVRVPLGSDVELTKSALELIHAGLRSTSQQEMDALGEELGAWKQIKEVIIRERQGLPVELEAAGSRWKQCSARGTADKALAHGMHLLQRFQTVTELVCATSEKVAAVAEISARPKRVTYDEANRMKSDLWWRLGCGLSEACSACPPTTFAEHLAEAGLTLPVALGSKWKAVGRARPTTGHELFNAALAAGLQAKREFTEADLKGFRVTELAPDSFIKVGDLYFQQGAADGKEGKLQRKLVSEIKAVHLSCKDAMSLDLTKALDGLDVEGKCTDMARSLLEELSKGSKPLLEGMLGQMNEVSSWQHAAFAL